VQDSELSAIVLRGLHKFPQARWEDMRSYGRALAQWLVRHGVEEDVTASSVRTTWLGETSPSAPPVAMDKVPELRVPRAPKPPTTRRDAPPPAPAPVFGNFDEAYEVPKSGFVKDAAPYALGGLALVAVVAGGLFVSGVFDHGAPGATKVAAAADQPVVAETTPPPPPPAEPLEPAPPPTSDEKAPTGPLDAGAPQDAGTVDAALDAAGPRRPSAPRAFAYAPPPRRQAAPEPKKTVSEPSDSKSTSLPDLKPPPDLGAGGQTANSDPYGSRNLTGNGTSTTNGGAKTPDKTKRNWGY
jgi:hypothetical protein